MVESGIVRAPFFLDTLVHDLRYAVRGLRKDRRFVATAVFALALGIGTATVGFGAFYSLLFNAFAAKDAGRLVILTEESAEAGGRPGMNLSPLSASLSDLDAIRSQNHAFEEVIGYTHGIDLLKDGTDNHQVYVGYVTGRAFDFYGVPPLLGRGIIPDDAKAGAAPIFVMSFKMWATEFNADANLIGKTFLLKGVPRTLVGVMPRRFQAFGAMNQVWAPIADTRDAPGSENEPSVNYMMARLKSGVTLAAASADLDVIVQRLAKSRPNQFPKHFTARVQSARDVLMGPWGIGTAGGAETEHFDTKHMLYDLLAGVMMILLIACSGVANLLLARAAAREKEIAVRTALGAPRGRLVRQLLTESMVLAIVACLLGCVFAQFGIKLVAAAIPHKGLSVGGEAVIGLDPTVLLFTLGVTALATLLCGLAPALHATGQDVQPALAGGRKGTGWDFFRGRFRSGLVMVEVALSTVLLVSAGLMIRSFYELTHIDLGFNAQNLFLLPVDVPFGSRTASEQQKRNAMKIEEGLRTLPGVVDLAVNNSLPGYNPGGRFEATVPGSVRSERVGFDGCSENLVRMLEMRMALGRWFSASEVSAAQPVAVINQTMAASFFAGENPLGRQIEAKGFDETVEPAGDLRLQVIGVVRDIKNFGPQVPALPMAFVPYTIKGGGFLFLKTKGDPALLMNPVRQVVWAVDRDAIFGPEMGPYLDIFYGLTYSTHELGLTTYTGTAGIALLLVVIGVFSVMAYTVSLETREIGVRMALGAQRGDVLGMVLKKGFVLLAVGISIGLFASVGVTRFLASQIWGVSPTDPRTYGAVLALVVVAGLAACYLPAEKATKVDPMVALRYE